MNYHAPFEPNCFYHVFNHAVGFENLYNDEENKRFFLQKYGEYINPVCRTFAYCLMNNHFHFLVQVRSELDLLIFFEKEKLHRKPHEEVPPFEVMVMQEFSNFCNSYAKSFNNRHKRRGALFNDKIRRIKVETFDYKKEMVRYIHYNPVKHGFTDRVQDWRFTSFHAMVSEQETQLERETVLEWFGGKENFLAVHQFDAGDWRDFDPDWEFGAY